MTICTFYYPGLLGPAIPIEELPEADWPADQQYRGLAQILSRADVQPLRRCSIEARLLYGLGISFSAEQDVPVAALRAAQLPDVQEASRLWCLDPVCLRIDQEQVVMLTNTGLALSESEAAYLIEDLNAHFAEDGLRIVQLTPHQWVLEGQFALTTCTLHTVLQRNINQSLPVGPDELRWRRLLNEAQMLLHDHPVNQQREQRGELPVNSLWLWGGGQDYHYEKIVDTVYSNEKLVQDVALVCDIAHRHLSAALQPALLRPGHNLFVYTDPLQAIRDRDVFRWFDELNDFEQQVLQPALTMLQQGQLSGLTIYSDSLSLSLNRKQLLRWWRWVQPFRKRILQLRAQYAD